MYHPTVCTGYLCIQYGLLTTALQNLCLLVFHLHNQLYLKVEVLYCIFLLEPGENQLSC